MFQIPLQSGPCKLLILKSAIQASRRFLNHMLLEPSLGANQASTGEHVFPCEAAARQLTSSAIVVSGQLHEL